MDKSLRKPGMRILPIRLAWILAGTLIALGAMGEPLHRSVPPGHALTLPAEDDRLRLFVRLEQPSVGELRASALTRGQAFEARAQRDHARAIDREHQRVSQSLAPFVDRELGRLRIGVNGIKVLAPRSSIAELEKLDGVLEVTPVIEHEPDNAASVAWVQAPQVWESLGDGAGLTVAVIDTGIDYLHANFGGAGDAEAYATNDFNVIEPGTFPTAKVIGGWDFAGPTYNSRVDEFPEPDPDPLDGNGHGSHVAGTAAGIGVEGRIGPGVAKGASLLALKVFSDGRGSTDLTSDAIDMALDPNQDGAMDDRVDVINMSLGARFGSPNDPSALASEVAVANGVVVVASAGNNGDRPYVTGSPAVSPGALSVAATIAGGRPRDALRVLSADPDVAGLYLAAEGAGPVAIVDAPMIRPLVRAFGPRALDADDVPLPGPGDDRACRGLSNAKEVRGNIVLVRAGDCSAETKYAEAQQAGAAGILVYNMGTQSNPPGVMGGIGLSGKTITVPGMMISGTDGMTLIAALASGPLEVEFDVRNTWPPLPELADRMTFFSSRGPATGGAGFKPELSAPGRFVVSTAAGTGIRARQLRGTSMAAPHVAGAAALVRQRHANLPVAAVKALLQNASADSEFEGPGSDTLAPLSRQGVGVVRVADSLALTSYAAPAGISFGYQATAEDTTTERTVTVHDLSGSERTFSIVHRPRGQRPGMQVNCPADITVPANGSATLEVTLAVDADALPADPRFLSHPEIDGWCVLSDGKDTLRVGYLAAADPLSALSAAGSGGDVTLTNAGIASGAAEGFRLLGLGGEAGDSATRSIAATGFRLGSELGLNIFQLGIALGANWETPGHVSMQMFIDADRNGRYDYLLFAGDWSLLGFDPGNWVTGVFKLHPDGEPNFDSGYLDWLADDIDFNDRVVVATWTMEPELGLSLLKPDTRVFDYRLVVFARDGSFDVQRGTVDLDADPVNSPATFSVAAGESLSLSFPHSAPDLWLLPGNGGAAQTGVVAPARKAPRSTRPRGRTTLSPP